MRKKGILSMIIILTIFVSGCATIMHGRSQYVQVDSVPSGASVYVEGNTFITPAKILLKRGAPMHEYQLLLQKEGFKPGYAKIGQKPSGWLWGDILWGIIPGITVDFLTGAAFDLYPHQVSVNLEQSVK
jgi:hypothetical protein